MAAHYGTRLLHEVCWLTTAGGTCRPSCAGRSAGWPCRPAALSKRGRPPPPPAPTARSPARRRPRRRPPAAAAAPTCRAAPPGSWPWSAACPAGNSAQPWGGDQAVRLRHHDKPNHNYSLALMSTPSQLRVSERVRSHLCGDEDLRAPWPGRWAPEPPRPASAPWQPH
jgi:hypothetical protein